jgi:hypothetical protein
VARGDRCREGVDYKETFSPVVRWTSVRLYLALTTLLGLVPSQVDVDLAYLYANLNEEIYLKPPQGVSLPENKPVWRLHKSLYGLPQSGRNWNKKINESLF